MRHLSRIPLRFIQAVASTTGLFQHLPHGGPDVRCPDSRPDDLETGFRGGKCGGIGAAHPVRGMAEGEIPVEIAKIAVEDGPRVDDQQVTFQQRPVCGIVEMMLYPPDPLAHTR